MSECSCVSVDVSCGSECLRDEKRTARKEYYCYECASEINIGDKYQDYVGKQDGEIFRVRTCVDCLSIRKSFFCNGMMFGIMLDNLEEHISELSGKISSDCLIPLTKKARYRVCDMIEKSWIDED